MAKRLAQQKRSEYRCPPKSCPVPADLRYFPELMNMVRQEHQGRIRQSRDGTFRAQRVAAKIRWKALRAKRKR